MYQCYFEPSNWIIVDLDCVNQMFWAKCFGPNVFSQKSWSRSNTAKLKLKNFRVTCLRMLIMFSLSEASDLNYLAQGSHCTELYPSVRVPFVEIHAWLGKEIGGQCSTYMSLKY